MKSKSLTAAALSAVALCLISPVSGFTQASDNSATNQGSSSGSSSDRARSQSGQSSSAGTGGSSQSSNWNQAQRQSSSESRQHQAKRTRELIGKTVKSTSGETLGELKDFVIDASSGTVLYGVVGTGGVFGIGSNLRAVPFTLFEAAASGGTEIRINIDKARWDSAPKFRESELSTLTQDNRGREIFEYYGQSTSISGRAQGGTQLVMVSKLSGQDLQSGSESVGRVEDVAVTFGSPIAVILITPASTSSSTVTTSSTTTEFVAVPFSRITVSANNRLTTTLARTEIEQAQPMSQTDVASSNQVYRWSAGGTRDQVSTGTTGTESSSGNIASVEVGTVETSSSGQTSASSDQTSGTTSSSGSLAATGQSGPYSSSTATDDSSQQSSTASTSDSDKSLAEDRFASPGSSGSNQHAGAEITSQSSPTTGHTQVGSTTSPSSSTSQASSADTSSSGTSTASDRFASTGSSGSNQHVGAEISSQTSPTTSSSQSGTTGITSSNQSQMPAVNPNPPISAATNALQSDPMLSHEARDVNITAEGGRLVLRGKVKDRETKYRIEAKVQQSAEGHQIDNQLTLPE